MCCEGFSAFWGIFTIHNIVKIGCQKVDICFMPFIKTIHKNHIKNAISFQTNKNNILCGDLIYHVNISLYLADGGVIFRKILLCVFPFFIVNWIEIYLNCFCKTQELLNKYDTINRLIMYTLSRYRSRTLDSGIIR